jgi:nucleoside-diphosphate-sugar epimerase
MNAPASSLSIRSAYNFSAFSFSPQDLAKCITVEVPDFSIQYTPDFRQAIADSWPASIDDSFARNDWGWKPEFTLEKMTKDMLSNIMRMDEIAI